MPMWLHITTLILSTLGVAVGGGFYWLLTAQSPLFLFALPVIVFVVEQIFEHWIPARCPRCRQRLMCQIFAKQRRGKRGGTGSPDEKHVVAYMCPACAYQFPNLQGNRYDW